jgi:hypothetical protein
VHYGDFILHSEVNWLRRGKVLFRFKELLPGTLEFLQDRDYLPPQLKDSHWFTDLAFLIDLTTKLNESNAKLQCESKAIIQSTGTVDSFKGKLNLRKTQVMIDVLTHFPSVESYADGTFDASVYILYTCKLLKVFERSFKDFEFIKFTASSLLIISREGCK